MTADIRTAGAASHAAEGWHTINWKSAYRIVCRLQARIVKAIQEGRWGKVKALQYLLTHSFSGKALAIRRVTENQGKGTPGVDREVWDTPEKKATALQALRQRGYNPQPLRRVYIGLEALPGDRTGRPVGSGRTLNDGQAARLRTILNEKSPEEVGIASPLWTRKAVAELIRKEYGIDMPVRTVGEYLERWGYTAKVPRRHAKDQDPEEVRHWLEVTYPAIEARAAREDAEIHWCDETGAAADQQPRRGYAREGRPARIEVPDPHIRMNLISTISNEGSVHFMTYKETMTAALFLTFLERMLSRDDPKDLPDRGSAEGP